MAVNKPTSKQIRGHFDALRVTKSHSLEETIDIAGGNFGSGRYFVGATEVSDASWVGATNVFYLYLDTDDYLVLHDTAGFPDLCTKLASIVITDGVISEIIDERASINGVEDGYYVYYSPVGNRITTSYTVQEAIDDLDAYVTSIIPRLGTNVYKYQDIDVMSGIKNGFVRVTYVNWTSALDLYNNEGRTPRVSYTVNIPKDYVQGTDLLVKLFWSPLTSDPGNVLWKFKYKVLKSGTDETNSVFYSTVYLQPSPGVDYRLTNTDNNFTIPFSDIVTNSDLLIICIEREPGIFDTYDHNIFLHKLRLEYVGRGILNSP